MPTLSKCFNCVKEIVLRLLVPIDYGLPRILRKLHIFDYELMQIIPKEVCAGVATMTIENAKEAALRPVFYVLLGRWLHDVQHNADTVLVVVPNDSLICVGSVAHDEAILAHTALGRLPAG